MIFVQMIFVQMTFVPMTFVPMTFVPMAFEPLICVQMTFVPLTFVLLIRVQPIIIDICPMSKWVIEWYIYTHMFKGAYVCLCVFIYSRVKWLLIKTTWTYDVSTTDNIFKKLLMQLLNFEFFFSRKHVLKFFTENSYNNQFLRSSFSVWPPP